MRKGGLTFGEIIMSTHDRTISLEARMDQQLHAFGYFTQDKQTDPNGVGLATRKVVAGLGAAGVGTAGAYAYKNREAIAAGGKDIARKGISKAAGGVDAVGEQMRKRAWKASANNSLKGVADSRMVGGLAKGAEVAGGLSKKIRSVSKFLSAGEIHAITHLAERIALLELEAEDEIHDFYEKSRTNKEAYRDRAIMIGGVGAAGAGAGAAYKYSPKFKAGVDGAREGAKAGYASAKGKAEAGYATAKGKASAGYGQAKGAVKDGYQTAKSASIVGSAQAKKKLVKAGADVGSRLRSAKGGLMSRFAKTAAKAV